MPQRNAPPQEQLDDRALVKLCLDGGEEAWRLLIERYTGLIYSVVLRRGYGRDLADEVFQSVVTTLFERLHLIADPACLPKWLMVTTERRARAYADKRRRETDFLPQAVADPAEGAEIGLVRTNLSAHVRAALADLDQRDRDVLLDLFAHDLPYTEVARRHGLAIGSLGSLRARALGRLRRVLEKRGVL